MAARSKRYPIPEGKPPQKEEIRLDLDTPETEEKYVKYICPACAQISFYCNAQALNSVKEMELLPDECKHCDTFIKPYLTENFVACSSEEAASEEV